MKPRGLLSLHTKLHTLRLHPLGFTGDCEELLVDLPASLRRFSLRGWGLYNPDKPTAEKPVSGQVVKHLGTVARSLEELALTDVRSLTTKCLVARGVFDKLVKKLGAVRRVSLSPAAVSQLSDLLAPLEFLEEVELVQGESISLEPLNYAETVQFIVRAKALRTISISQVGPSSLLPARPLTSMELRANSVRPSRRRSVPTGASSRPATSSTRPAARASPSCGRSGSSEPPPSGARLPPRRLDIHGRCNRSSRTHTSNDIVFILGTTPACPPRPTRAPPCACRLGHGPDQVARL